MRSRAAAPATPGHASDWPVSLSRGQDADRGAALLTVLGTMLLLSAVGLSLVMLSMSETLASGNVRRARAALYAAEAGLERVVPDLLAAEDWDAILEGRIRSGFADGAPSGVRVLDGGRTVDLERVVNLANCNRASSCSAAAMDAVTAERPWGRNNPRWRLFGYGPLAALSPEGGPAAGAGLYVVVLVADDPSENDDDPARDGSESSNPGAGVLLLRAEAHGPESALRVVEATVARSAAVPEPAGYPAQRGPSWTGTPGMPPPVQLPGGELSQLELPIASGGMRRP